MSRELTTPALKLYAQNAASFRWMADKAASVAPKKYRGYTAEQLRQKADEYEAIAEERAMPTWIGRASLPCAS